MERFDKKTIDKINVVERAAYNWLTWETSMSEQEIRERYGDEIRGMAIKGQGPSGIRMAIFKMMKEDGEVIK